MSSIFGGNPGYVRLKKLYNSIFPGKSSIIYLLRDEFTTPQAAPLTSPRTCEPGPGIETITDTGNKVSTSSGALQIASGTGLNDPLIFSQSLSDRSGRTLLTSCIPNGSNINITFGWNQLNTNYPTHGFRFSSTTLTIFANGVSISINLAYVNGTTYRFAVVRRSVGNFYFILGGIFTDWTLVFITYSFANANIWAGFGYPASSVDSCSIDYFRVRDVGGAFASDYGIATLNVATAVSGTNYAADADGIYDLAFTLPAGSANLVAAELRFRQQDATNYWTFYIKRNAGNTAWDAYLDKVTAGVPATQAGFPVTGVGTVDMLRVIADGNLIDCYSKTVTTWTKRGGEINSASFATQSTLVPVAGAGTTLGAIQGWARRSALYNVLSAT